ncbi:MAG: TetR family transcriptional regulator [Actinomycetota bacterium]|nr:TetR family transcriptional regulator [Actinomycetota bacterium]
MATGSAFALDRVLRAALALANEAGESGLSMRNLGRKLGVEAMSLYEHVVNKEDLLDGLIELVFSEIGVPDPGELDWKTAMRRRAMCVR